MKSAKKFAKALREKIEALCEKIEGNNFNLQEIRNEVLKIPKRERENWPTLSPLISAVGVTSKCFFLNSIRLEFKFVMLNQININTRDLQHDRYTTILNNILHRVAYTTGRTLV